MAKAPAIGIDLGTTYSCVAVYRNGKVEIIPNEQGNRTTPSYVAFTELQRLVGDPAKDQAKLNPKNTIFDAKRLIGRRFEDETVQNDMQHWPFTVINENSSPKIQVEYKGETKTFCCEEISAMVLAKMKESAEAYLRQSVTNAVITVPAYFNDSQRQATKDAGTIAGLNVLRIINEPTAAAIAYGLDLIADDTGERNALIFDLGGGTFDVSVFTIKDGIFEVKATAGDTHLGGEDFDNRLVNYCLAEIKNKYKKDLTSNKRALRRLRTACEKAKRSLTSALYAGISIDSLFEDIDFSICINRARFEKLNSDLFGATLEPVKKALNDAELEKAQIDDVVLIGGSTRIPRIQKLLQDFFDGKELIKSINPDEAVAHGAAVQAAILNGDMSKEVQNLVLRDITPLSLGIKCNTNEVKGYMSVLIDSNTPIPAKETNVYWTGYDNQKSIFFEVFQGEDEIAENNYLLGEFKLSGIQVLPRGECKVEVTFEIDVNGILKVTATEKSTGNTKDISITNHKGRLSQMDIKKMVRDAKIYKQEDERLRAIMAAKNSLEKYCLNVMSALDNETLRDKVTESDKNAVLSKCNEVIQWFDSIQFSEKEVFEAKQKELVAFCHPILLKLSIDADSLE